jgi:uncharacterized protein (DUF2062 family)
VLGRFQTRIRQFATTLLTEKLDPGRAAAAVFLGLFIGIVPIYGLQTIVALGLALLFRLNKPLTLASTFINNPLFLLPTIASSVELGCFLRSGRFQPWNLAALTRAHLKEEFISFVVGSLVLGIIIGILGAAITAVIVHCKSNSNSELRVRIRFVNQTFAHCPWFDRGFVRWKLRLDRIFGLLAAEDLGSGTIVDLGCGHGIAICFAAGSDSSRRLVGCDLNEHRIAVARQAFRTLNAEMSVADVRAFELPLAGLILILDVLQYLSAEEQLALLQRCCSALTPNGRLIFRVHDCRRGLWSIITMAFDNLLFSCEHAGMKPLMLAPEQYQNVLEAAGMKVESRRFTNRLPLAHILFVANKSSAEPAL